MMKITILCVVIITIVVTGKPQSPVDTRVSHPEPYDFQYKVEDQPTKNYFGASEVGDQAGKVTGSYYVLLADGRLMTVEYTVDGDSGFVPKISFTPNANPFQG